MVAPISRIGLGCLLLGTAVLSACAADESGPLAPVEYLVDDPRPGLAVQDGRAAAEPDDRPGLPVIATARPAAEPEAGTAEPPFRQAAPAGPVERRSLPPPGRQDGGSQASMHRPDPVDDAAADVAAAPAGNAEAPGETTVAAGETLSAVSRRTGVPLRELIEENGLTAPFVLRPGDRLKLPGRRVHTVQAGDTVYNISRRYGVDQASLMASNDIAPPYTIRLGQRLQIPGRVDAVPAAQGVPAALPATAAPVAVAGAPGPVPSPDVPESRAPMVLSVAPGHLVPPPSVRPSRVIEEPDPDLLPRPQRRPVEAPPAAVALAVPDMPDRSPTPARGQFVWPVAGDLISRYGPRPGGQHNDGINVQAIEGSTVRATDAGVIAYAGNEIRGYGNLVLIRHAKGWMSAYAHCRRLLVKKGDTVARGQPIAEVGRTGNVTVPQLHFEIRRNGDALDPLTVLPGGA